MIVLYAAPSVCAAAELLSQRSAQLEAVEGASRLYAHCFADSLLLHCLALASASSSYIASTQAV